MKEKYLKSTNSETELRGMIDVSDTTPLISLIKIDHVDFLEKLFGKVLIPQAEFDELTSNDVRRCIDELQRAGRHIGQKHYQMLLDMLSE